MSVINFISLIIGWFLGIASHLTIDSIRRISSKRDLFNGINSELKELLNKLVLVAYQLGLRSGKYDRDFLEWCLKMHRKFSVESEIKTFSEVLEEFVKYSDEDLASFAKLKRAEHKSVGLSLKKYNLAFLNSRMSDLTLLNVKLQSILLNIRDRLNMMNEEIEFTMKHHYMTFDSSISSENHQRLIGQIQENHSNIQNMAIDIVNMINTYFERYENLTSGLTLTEKCLRIFSRSS